MTSLESHIRQAINQLGQEAVASLSGKNRATIAKIMTDKQGVMLRDLEALLVAIEMKVVPLDSHIIDPVEHELLLLTAAEALRKKAHEIKG